MSTSDDSPATVDNLLAQMSRGASVLNQWDAVLNIDEDLVNQLFALQFAQTARADWKRIVIGYCQVFPNPQTAGQLAVYTAVVISLETPSLTFLGNSTSFVRVAFKATGSTGTSTKAVSSGFDPKRDGDPNDPTLDWSYSKFEQADFVGEVPLAAIAGTSEDDGAATRFVLNFPEGSFNAPFMQRVKDPSELQLQLKTYLVTHGVEYVISSIRTDLLDQVPQLAPKAFRIAVLTTNTQKNIFQIFIATDHPPQRDLTINVNEPLPDGYRISAMFNQSSVQGLGNSLLVQSWLFLQSNLVFPGYTVLSLGPEHTPTDALVLGNLEVRTSPVKPINPEPSEPQAMLNIQKTAQIEVSGQPAFTAYGDDADPNAWYVPPKVVWARQSGSGAPQFALIQYNLTGGKVSGFCRFSVQLQVDPVQAAALQKQIPGATTPQFDWISSAAAFTYTIGGKSKTVQAQPSNFGSQTVSFSVPLANAAEIADFVNAFSPGGSQGGTFSVSYDLAANTRLPAVTVVSSFNSSIAYRYQVENKYRTETTYHTDTWGNSSSQQVQVFVGTFVHEMLNQSQAGSIQVTPGKGLTPTLLNMVETWAHQQLQSDVERALNTALALIKNPTNDFSMESVASFTNTFETSDVVPWYFTVDSTLPTFDQATWASVHSEVNQQQLQVSFEVQVDLRALGVERLNVSLKYGDTPPKTHTFSPDDQSVWNVSLPGLMKSGSFISQYSYQYDVVYAKPAQGNAPATLSTTWLDNDSTSVKFGVVELGLMPVTFEATNIGWARPGASDQDGPLVKEISVDWNWLPGSGGPVLSETLVLNATNPSVQSTLRSAGPTQNQQYQYSLTFLMSDGTKLHANGLTGTQSRQPIDHPLSTITIDVLPIFPSDAKAVILRATFDDEFNNIHLGNNWQAIATPKGILDTSFAPWVFKAVVANTNATTVVFSGTWLDKDAKQHAIPQTLVIGGMPLMISSTQKTVTGVIDASNVKFVPAQSDGVYRVVALVASSEEPEVKGTNPLANATTLTFMQNTAPIQYVPLTGIDIDQTPTFYFQYTYTENSDKASHTKVTDNWSSPQSTVSTALPVVPGTPPGEARAAPVRVAAKALDARAPLDKRTAQLFERHQRFCDVSKAEGEAVLSSVLKRR